MHIPKLCWVEVFLTVSIQTAKFFLSIVLTMFPNFKKFYCKYIYCDELWSFSPAKLSCISTISHTPHIHKYLQCSELENEVPLALHNTTEKFTTCTPVTLLLHAYRQLLTVYNCRNYHTIVFQPTKHVAIY